MVKDITAKGDMVPPSVTVDLLLANMRKHMDAGKKVGFEGFCDFLEVPHRWVPEGC
jgi:hypothetical protein